MGERLIQLVKDNKDKQKTYAENMAKYAEIIHKFNQVKKNHLESFIQRIKKKIQIKTKKGLLCLLS